MSIAPTREWELPGQAGISLFARSWLPAGEARDVVVISHGYAEHGGRYGNVVDRLVPLGFAVHAMDHRGHGRSGGPRALIDRMDYVFADLHAFIGKIRAQHSDQKIKLIGHSMGGSIALGYALQYPEALSGLILSGPAVGEFITPFQRTLITFIGKIAPRMGTVALSPDTISRDPDVVAAYVNDPLVTVGKVPARTIAELVNTAHSYPGRVSDMRVPVLVQHGLEDIPAPYDANREIYANIGAPDKTIRTYEGLYHEIYNEPEHPRVLDDLVAWLDAHRAAS